MYANNVAPPKNMLLTQWFFQERKARMLPGEIAASNQPHPKQSTEIQEIPYVTRRIDILEHFATVRLARK